MDFSKLIENWRVSASLCPSLADRFKLMYWSYSRKFVKTHPFTIRLRTREKTPLELRVRNNYSDQAMAREVFEKRCYDVPLSAPPGTILDLGGNVGFAAVFFALRHPQARLATVEPIPGNLALLRENVARHAPHARVFEAAASTGDGTIQMALSSIDSEHHVAGAGEGATLEVAGLTIETMLKELGWEQIDLLKIDIEGYESELLYHNTAWLSRVRAIVMEIHPPLTDGPFREWAAGAGFAVTELEPFLYFLTRPAH